MIFEPPVCSVCGKPIKKYMSYDREGNECEAWMHVNREDDLPCRAISPFKG